MLSLCLVGTLPNPQPTSTDSLYQPLHGAVHWCSPADHSWAGFPSNFTLPSSCQRCGYCLIPLTVEMDDRPPPLLGKEGLAFV